MAPQLRGTALREVRQIIDDHSWFHKWRSKFCLEFGMTFSQLEVRAALVSLLKLCPLGRIHPAESIQ